MLNLKLEKMKKFLGLMLLCATAFVFYSCSKDNTSNPLEGTLWSHDSITSLLNIRYTKYVEFIDDSNVKIWDSYTNTSYVGTYTIDGNTIKFYNLYNSYWKEHYAKGSFTSNSVTIHYYYDVEPSRLYDDVYMKK